MARSPRFTDQQQAILATKNCSVAVSAGAGCGKTFVLTQRFIGYLRGSTGRADPLASIVAITFTDRAAREMRHRVRLACEAELRECAPEHVTYWLAVLRGLDGARITTIHAFCSNLLRRFAVEAALDPTFAQLDVSFGDTYVRRAVRQSLCRLLETDDVDATQLVIRFGFEGVESLLQQLLNGIQTVDRSSLDGMSHEDLARSWRTVWQDECLPCLVEEFRESDVACRVVELLQEHEPSHPAMRQRRALLLETLTAEPIDPSPELLQSIRKAAQVQGGGGKSAWIDESVYEDVKTAFESLRKQIKDLLEKIEEADADAIAAAALALTAHRVARTVADDYAQRKRNEARVDFDDLLCLSRDLLRDDVGVRRRAVSGIDLLMVDEFQDTDPVQAELVRLLCGDQLVNGRLFLVGDAKQSIYRFRKADPRVFAALRNDLPAAGRLPLTTNFRSRPAILRFVNYTFAPEMPEYEPLVPIDERQHSPEPSVEFLFSSSEEKDENAEARRRREARWIALRIKALLADETPRIRDLATGELRPVRPGDVAILFRALSNVHLYEQALSEQSLEYYLAGGRAFFAQQEVYDIAHLCRWLEDPADELSLAGALRSPLFGLTDDTLLLLKPERSASFHDGLRRPPSLPDTQAAQVRRTARILDELRAKKDFLGIAELLTLAIERTGYDAALLCEHLGPRKLANLRKLIGLARSLDAAGPVTLNEFVFRLNEAVREQDKEELAATHPEVANVLRLMTIHQSKGLEFSVVILADMDWRRRGGDGRACYDRSLGPIFPIPDDEDGRLPHLGLLIHRHQQSREEEAEQTRLFYVAATRARDHLILSAGLEHDGKPRSPWLQLLARRFDLLAGLPALDPYLGSVDGTVKSPTELPTVLVHREEPKIPTGAKKPRGKQVRLQQLRELVSQTPVAELPPLIGRIEPKHSERDEFTISEICVADRVLNANSFKRKRERAVPRPADALDVEPLDDSARRIGILTHSVLEQIDFARTAGAADESVSSLVERAALSMFGDVDPKLRRTAVDKIAALLESSLAQELKNAKRLHREIGFRLRRDRPTVGRPAELIGTIDCLYEDELGWHILDYKTTDSPAESVSDAIQQYRLQILAYALAVEKLIGRPPTSLRIVRLGPPVEMHAVAADRDTLDGASRRIDAAMMALRGR
ncbi:MAG: UvrD-helicase domain-containing protein [Planctomycetota bacterium]|nr:UvrD-helicase domain-containing protein [Planctomycetota bacterium]